MRVGIICAGDREVEPFLPWIENVCISEKSMLKIYTGKIENIEVAVLFCGVCKTNAAIATQILIDTYQCDCIVNAGTAGGMKESIKLYDTIVCTESAYWDVTEDILTEFHPWLESVFFQSDSKLLDLAKKTHEKNEIPAIFYGRIITGEAFITNEYRDEINEKFNPLCVDMETASIAHACHVNNIPFIAVRSITDTCEHCGMDEFEKNCIKASIISANFVKSMLKELALHHSQKEL